ncbi:MAG TPA: histidine kinase dimerization/phospho-acceptor domain-containing protein [Kofleriaceae bacterium]|nr:histidine kinase dimerization/phospho-acceptor domain-containing protein [Kofleriaceae bacterium]
MQSPPPQFLEAMLTGMSQAGIVFFLVAPDASGGTILFADDAARTLIGRDPATLVNTPIASVLRSVPLGLRDGATQLVPFQSHITLPNGELRPVQVMIIPSAGTAMSPKFVMLKPRDEAIDVQVAHLEADRQAMVTALTTGLAHEINNPLTAIVLNLSSLRKLALASPDAGGLLPLIDTIAAATDKISNNLRALSTLVNQGALQRVDVAAVAKVAVRWMAPSFAERAEVCVRLTKVPTLMCDEARVGQAIVAMLLYAGSGFLDDTRRGTINLDVCATAERIVVTVTDDGRTPTEWELENAFDPFFRFDRRAVRIGVGLGVTRAVAVAAGGGASICAHAGGGVTMEMWLPLTAQPAP